MDVITADVNKVAEEGLFEYIPKQNIDFIAGGFPCQPFSYAGKKMGLEDTQGTVFYSLSSIIKEASPKVIFLENVKGLISHDKGRTFSTILDVLNEIGHFVSYRVLTHGIMESHKRGRGSLLSV